MKTLVYLFLLLPFLFFAQRKKLKPLFGLSLNSGVEKINQQDKNLEIKKNNSIGCYVSIGLNLYNDSTYIFYTGLKYGRENSRFSILSGDAKLQFRTANRPLCFIFAPGVHINQRHSLFLVLSVVRVLQANSGGGGGGSAGGKDYYYEYIDNLPQNSWDFRPGLKWQFKPKAEKKFTFELGFEPSLITRKLEMKKRNPYSNIPEADYHASYDVILFYCGLQF